MSYERLTVVGDAKYCRHKKAGVADWQVVERLAELEDKLENGTLVELPKEKRNDYLCCTNRL